MIPAERGPSGTGHDTAATLRWHYEAGTWWAESPEYPEWSGGADSLDEARMLAHGGLRWLGAPTVIDPFGEPPNVTTGVRLV